MWFGFGFGFGLFSFHLSLGYSFFLFFCCFLDLVTYILQLDRFSLFLVGFWVLVFIITWFFFGFLWLLLVLYIMVMGFRFSVVSVFCFLLLCLCNSLTQSGHTHTHTDRQDSCILGIYPGLDTSSWDRLTIEGVYLPCLVNELQMAWDWDWDVCTQRPEPEMPTGFQDFFDCFYRTFAVGE